MESNLDKWLWTQIYNDIPPVICNKSEESDNFQCEERMREHKWGLHMHHYLSLITFQWHVEVKCRWDWWLMRFSVNVHYVAGKSFVIAYALSISSDGSLSDWQGLWWSCVWIQWCCWSLKAHLQYKLDVMMVATVHDKELQQVIRYVCNG